MLGPLFDYIILANPTHCAMAYLFHIPFPVEDIGQIRAEAS